MRQFTLPLAFILLASISFAGVVSSLTKKKATWEFIQATGGIEVVSRETKDKISYLNLKYDVSGLTHVTRDPETMNSGLVVREIEASFKDEAIYIEIFTSVPDKNSKNGTLHKVKLPEIEHGIYPVYYGETNDSERKIGIISL